MKQKSVAIIGAGPAGLFAAQILSQAGCCVSIYDQKQTPARKFLMAGRGGLNITHSEDYNKFVTRYGKNKDFLIPALNNFTPYDMQSWCHDLGIETFIGSSGRVFPKSMKASSLLRNWLLRLNTLGVSFHMRHCWVGWNKDDQLSFLTPNGVEHTSFDSVLLCLGGASWPSLGSDGKWKKILQDKGVFVQPFEPSNCGFSIQWSDYFRKKFSGTPIKSTCLRIGTNTSMGEITVTQNGIEGGAVYSLSSIIRNAIHIDGQAELYIDFRPNMSIDEVISRLLRPKGRQSLSTWLQKSIHLSPVEIALMREKNKDLLNMLPNDLAHLIKSTPLVTNSPFSLERAISSAGGLSFLEINSNYMLKQIPGVFAAGEMLDWEAPTGGYLLQGCFATGKAAAMGILHWLQP